MKKIRQKANMADRDNLAEFGGDFIGTQKVVNTPTEKKSVNHLDSRNLIGKKNTSNMMSKDTIPTQIGHDSYRHEMIQPKLQKL